MSSATELLAMTWPQSKLLSPPPECFPTGYRANTVVDRPAFTRIQAAIGWRMREGQWDSFMDALVPGSMILAEHDETGDLVAVACGSHVGEQPKSAELGWVAVVPKHRGKGLGTAVCAAVTARLLDVGYQDVHLSTNHDKLAALSIYLRLGYLPDIDPATAEQWRVVHQQLDDES
jgi:mycothiol synthase